MDAPPLNRSAKACHIPGAGLRNSSKSKHANARNGTPILRATKGSFLRKSDAREGTDEAWLEMRRREYLRREGDGQARCSRLRPCVSSTRDSHREDRRPTHPWR